MPPPPTPGPQQPNAVGLPPHRDHELGEAWPLLPPPPPPVPQRQNRIDGQPVRVWNNTYPAGNYRPTDIPFQGNEGITVPMPDHPQVLDYFSLYFTDNVINQMWRETNRYAE